MQSLLEILQVPLVETNPTNGYLVMMTPENVMETDVPVSDAVSFIISMGTAGATAEVLKKSYS